MQLQALYTLAARDLERELVPLLQDQKLGLMVWSPLAGGLLSGKYKRGQPVEAGRLSTFDVLQVNKEKVFDIVDALQPMAKNKGATVAQLALAWLLHQPVVSTVIIGANKAEQLEDNLKAVNITFTPAELQQLDALTKLPKEYPGWVLEATGGDRKK